MSQLMRGFFRPIRRLMSVLLVLGLVLGAGVAPALAAGVSVDAVLPALGATIGGTPVVITGSGFEAGATVTIGGQQATNVVVVNDTTITATTPAGVNGVANVVVTNPDSQGDTLLAGYIYTDLAPTVLSLAPGTILAGTPGATVTLVGTGFTAAAEVLLNGQPRATVYVSQGELRVQLLPGDLAVPGSATLTVRNTLGTSNGATLTIAAPLAPVVASVTPAQLVVGSPAATVTVLGANFTPGAQVLVNGTPRATTYVSPNEVRAELLPGDLAAPGDLALTVQAGAGTSNPAIVTVTAGTGGGGGGGGGGGADGTPPTLSAPFLVGTGEVPPSGMVTFLATLQDDAALGGLQASSSAGGPWQTVASVAGTGPVRAAGGFDLTDPAYGGSAAAGPKTVYLRAVDAAGNVSDVVGPAVTYSGRASTFPDVPAGHPNAEAIRELAARGIIKGYQDGRFGPGDPTLRAQMAALIARGMGWGGEEHGNPFPDRGPVDDELWRQVGTLAFHNVAKGYPDGKYRPTQPVLSVQAVAFISRAMVALGYWAAQPDDPALYPNVPAASGHRTDLATYHHYVGAVPGTTATAGWAAWDRPATRAFFAEAEWRVVRWREAPANWGVIPRP